MAHPTHMTARSQLEEARSVEIERHIDVFEDVNLGPPDNGGG